MSVENLKSVTITNLDATPIVANSAGEGAQGYAIVAHDYITISASASQTSTYKLLRVPTVARIKELILENAALTTGRINLSVYYSDSTTDGTAVANQGLIVPTTGDQFFASDIDLTSAAKGVDVTNESGNYPVDKRNSSLWSALGLTTDPGGFFDIVAVVHTTDVTIAGKIGLTAVYNV